ncbi:MAG: adenosylmethionine decarboxylase [Methylococcaceae bacterium]|jgi:S-adenosylmethionine decarboxylase|nr:adenosylmethionine decarboxylase [Methylococcaceae bacterium]
MSPKLFDHYRKKEEVTIGKHLLIECKGRQAFLKEKELRTLMEEAAVVAGATVLSHHFHSFGEGCGLTGVLVLSHSHMSVHQWPEKGYAAFDVFMCGDAQPELSAKYIAESFSDSIVEVRSLDRCLPFES